VSHEIIGQEDHNLFASVQDPYGEETFVAQSMQLRLVWNTYNGVAIPKKLRH
jgi:hypothetical protein